jgi:hypothetical protein
LSYTPPPSVKSDADFDRDIDRCRFAYLTDIISPTFRESFYPFNRLGERAYPRSVAEEGEGAQTKTFAALIEIQER